MMTEAPNTISALIVDDHWLGLAGPHLSTIQWRETSTTLSQHHNIRLKRAYSLEGALEIIRRGSFVPNIVVFDMFMPQTDPADPTDVKTIRREMLIDRNTCKAGRPLVEALDKMYGSRIHAGTTKLFCLTGDVSDEQHRQNALDADFPNLRASYVTLLSSTQLVNEYNTQDDDRCGVAWIDDVKAFTEARDPQARFYRDYAAHVRFLIETADEMRRVVHTDR